MARGIGKRFHTETKYSPGKLSGGGLQWTARPDAYKEFPDARRVILPRPRLPDRISFERLVRERRSIRRFSAEPLTLDDLSALLWASNGVSRVEAGFAFRTVPSAGALYPIETYLVVNRAEGVPAGVFHYAVQAHALEELRVGDFRNSIAQAALGQEMCAEAACVFVWTAVFKRSTWKYGERGYRYVYLDAGHVGHALALCAVALELGSCQVGALFDDEMNRILGVDGEGESVVYMSVVGHPRR